MEDQDHPLQSAGRRPITSGGEQSLLVAASPPDDLLSSLSFASPLLRPCCLAVFVVGASPAGAAAGDVYVHAGANFKPVTIAVTPFIGEESGDKIGSVVSNDFARSIFLLPINPTSFPETVVQSRRPPEHRRLEDGQRAIRADRPRAASGQRPCDRAVPAVGRRRPASRSPASNIRPRPPTRRRVAHMIADAVFARVDRREGVLRLARRLRRRERPEGQTRASASP